jgi:hypothetical protein
MKKIHSHILSISRFDHELYQCPLKEEMEKKKKFKGKYVKTRAEHWYQV